MIDERTRPRQPAELTTRGHVAGARLPRQLVDGERLRGPRRQSILCLDRLRLKRDRIVGKEFQKRIANPFDAGGGCEFELRIRHRAERWRDGVLGRDERRDEQ
jgi:hypothetical protein